MSVEGKAEAVAIVRKRVFIISRASPFRSQVQFGLRNYFFVTTIVNAFPGNRGLSSTHHHIRKVIRIR